ncbi:MAG: M56 family metallopeptidase [Verrucomicrobiales bacterium]|nr:M56 family metallopeptidase [Verrucomicrobiales bacterium]
MENTPPDYEVFLIFTRFIAHTVWLGVLFPLFYFLYIKSSPRFQPKHRVACGLALILSIPLLAIILTTCPIPFPDFVRKFRLTIPVTTALWITLIWLAGLAVRSVGIVYRAKQLKQLIKTSIEIPSTYSEKITNACLRIPFPKDLFVRVTQTETGPMLCGLRRPVILLPETTVSESDSTEISAILAHETAHYQRRDIALNLMQTATETLCFFHPAILWLSREIRIEREKACDDQAVELLNGNRFGYASALLNAETTLTSHSACAAAFGIGSTSDRAVRIAFGEHREQKPFSGILAIASLLIVVTISLAITSVVKVAAQKTPDPIVIDPVILSDPAPPLQVDFDKEFLWRDKKIGNQYVPVLKSIPLIERQGIVYNLANREPQLFPQFPNRWLLDNQLDFLDSHLPYTDPDKDLFTVLEEYEAGTDPKNSASHPDPVFLLGYRSLKFELYRIQFAAQPDEKTVQLTRIPTTKHPQRATFLLKAADRSSDGRIQIDKIASDTVTISDIQTGGTRTVRKGDLVDFKTYYAEFTKRGGDNFFVKANSTFIIQGFPEEKYRLVRAGKDSCEIRKGEEVFTLGIDNQ